MRELLTGDDLYAEILMLKRTNACVLLVEGPDDVDALDAHVSEESAMLLPGYGKTSVLYALDLCEKNGVEYALAILDRDWVGIDDEGSKSPNVVYTDMYDLDATILFSGQVARRVVGSFSNAGRLKDHMKSKGLDQVFDFAIPISSAVGVLRLAIRQNRLPLSVRDFPTAAAMDLDGGPADIEKILIIAEARAVGGYPVVNRPQVNIMIDDQLRALSDPKRYCSGHDLTTALTAVMRGRWGSKLKSADVARALRAAFGCPELMRTSMYRDVQSWSVSRSIDIWTCPAILDPA
jgi:hypothetical protein